MTTQNRPFTLLIILLLCSVSVYAQQDPYYSHFNFIQQAYNPAELGRVDRKICISMLTHRQWRDYDDNTWTRGTNGTTDLVLENVAPNTNNVNIALPVWTFNNGHEIKAGVSVFQDLVGVMRTTSSKAQLAYQIPINRRSAKISLGVDLGLTQFGFVNPQFRVKHPFDPRVPTASESGSKGDFGAGVLYSKENVSGAVKKLCIGASVQHINRAVFELSGIRQFQLAQHFYVHSGADVSLGNGATILEPAILVKYNSKPQVDLSMTVLRQRTLRVGLGYRQWGTSDALTILMGYVKGPIQIGYSYDMTLSKIRTVSDGTHELMLKYCLDLQLITKMRECGQRFWYKTPREL